MSKNRTNKIHFRAPGRSGGNNIISVWRLTPEKAAEAAVDIQRIGQAAYRAAFERTPAEPARPLESGTVSTHLFNPANQQFVRAQQQRIEESASSGVAYYGISAEPEELAGLFRMAMTGVVKTSPSPLKPWKRFFREGNCFINDVMTMPNQQHQGLATAGIYTALQEYSPNKEIASYVFDHSTLLRGTLGRALGLQQQQALPPRRFDGHSVLTHHQYGDVTVETALQGLQAQYGWLSPEGIDKPVSFRQN